MKAIDFRAQSEKGNDCINIRYERFFKIKRYK